MTDSKENNREKRGYLRIGLEMEGCVGMHAGFTKTVIKRETAGRTSK